METDPLEVIHRLSKTLEAKNRPLSIQQLAKDSQLPSDTVRRYIRLMEAAKESPDFRVITSPKRLMVEPIGFLSLPEAERLSYLRTNYSVVGEEGLMMLSLYRAGAVSSKSGIKMTRSKIVDGLIDAEQIEETKGKFFLTELGKRVAKGMLKIYPEMS